MLNVSIIVKGKGLLSLNTSEVERYDVDAAMETIGNRLPHVSITMCAYHYCIVCTCIFRMQIYQLDFTPTEKIFAE